MNNANTNSNSINANNYQLRVEYQEIDQTIDDEADFRYFCDSIAHDLDNEIHNDNDMEKLLLQEKVNTSVTEHNSISQPSQPTVSYQHMPVYSENHINGHYNNTYQYQNAHQYPNAQQLPLHPVMTELRHYYGTPHNTIAVAPPQPIVIKNYINTVPPAYMHLNNNYWMQHQQQSQQQPHQQPQQQSQQQPQQQPQQQSQQQPQQQHQYSNNTVNNNQQPQKHQHKSNKRHNNDKDINTRQLKRNTPINNIQPLYDNKFNNNEYTINENDIRLKYAMLFVNAFNGFDRDDMASKLKNWSTPDCLFTVKWTGKIGNPCGPSERIVQGAEPVASIIEAIMVRAVPDAVFQLLGSKLRIRSDHASYLICKYSFKGTQVCKIEPVSSANNNTGSPIIKTEHSKDAQITNKSQDDTSQDKHQVLFCADTMLPKIVKLSTLGTMILHINRDKKVNRFEFIQEVIHMKEIRREAI